MMIGVRSLLFVPADDERKIAKALSSEADAIILDLEDSVAPAGKAEARKLAAKILQQARVKPIWVRVNSIGSGLAEADVAAVRPYRPDGLVQPKTIGAKDVSQLSAFAGAPIPIIAIVTETPASLLNMNSYTTVASSLAGLTWGGEDLSSELGAVANRDLQGNYTDPYRLARALCLVTARACGTEPIDAVYTNYRDAQGLEAEAADAARDGFTAKLAIHPDQIAIINRAFTPSEASIARARKIVAAFESTATRGVVGLDGEMLDMPHLERARRLLARVHKK